MKVILKKTIVMPRLNQEKIAWAAPYDCIKDPEDSSKFIIDGVTAPIVKMIYELALEGLSLHKIAKILNGLLYGFTII